MGGAVMSYVAKSRDNAACRLLRDTDLSIMEVAHRVGYDSVPAFSGAFKVQVGMPPASWRTSITRR